MKRIIFWGWVAFEVVDWVVLPLGALIYYWVRS